MIALRKVATPRLLRTEKVAGKVAAYERIDSTHAEARRLIRQHDIAHDENGGIAITVVAAGALDDPRGRLGRPWASVPGDSFAMSFIAEIPESIATDDAVNGWLSMIAGLAALDAIEGSLDECGAVPFDPDCGFKLKWPNDIYCHGLKLGGTFTQVSSPPDSHGDVAVVFSVGLNLSVPADRLPTPRSTSLQMHVTPLPATVDLIDMIAARLAVSLRNRLEAFVQMPLIQSSRLRSEMRHVCWMMGRPVNAQLIDGREVSGTVVSLNDDASISVRTGSGDVVRLSTGDVGLMV
ncbi:biotin--[acetyl-CoA-carboxylase] ligase [Bifidobacterium leontopitheci]|uniref:Biotin--[acetyl-CoA-carboxylase] ligase n=1 Tax=Bifidobacterium leontopitheci TaxID=2650774 RepID=A0A6I1GK40_9BIFI|nr:biotin--acetyl-CoA-carboxylase ligase [Bifidobacterium leontopitheci]KAB7791112.1 biotin--[acetyl-CoA-carboxylase] ligase [Bifidobacterium leontopitheci]